MHALSAYNVCMKQYIIRKIPDHIDRIAREKAKKINKSLNAVLLKALEDGLNASNNAVYHDLDEFSGSWVSDSEVEMVLDEFRTIENLPQLPLV